MADEKDNKDADDATDDKPPCCPSDSLGPATIFHDKTPIGSMVEMPAPEGLVGLKPMPCYLTGEPIASTGRIVVVFTDVYGIDSGHHKVFADCLAERLAETSPTSVLIPDLFRGHPILQPLFDNSLGDVIGAPGMVYRIKRNYPPEKVESDVFHMIVPYICSALGDTACPPMSCVGFCFGGWVVGRILGHLQRQSIQFKCGVGIHPSFKPNVLHGESLYAMAERIHRPILLLPAINDVELKPGTIVTNAIPTLEEDREVSIEFPTMMHGWVSRGDPTDPTVAAEQERAMQLTVNFIQKYEHSSIKS